MMMMTIIMMKTQYTVHYDCL